MENEMPNEHRLVEILGIITGKKDLSELRPPITDLDKEWYEKMKKDCEAVWAKNPDAIFDIPYDYN